MAFEEWLALGGNEIINNARAVGYARTANCPMGWFKGDICDTLAAATLAAEQYDNAERERSPWYDPVLPDVSARFFGAFGLSIQNIESSTRTATITEGLAHGGVIGRVRKAVRHVRVRALLTAEGQDALEYGMAWLNAALDPNACGTHGDACGTSDLSFFSTCPPARKQLPAYSDFLPTYVNLATNPSMEASSGTVEARRNFYVNPRMENSVANWVVTGVTQTAAAGGTVIDVVTAVPPETTFLQPDAPVTAAVDQRWYTAFDVTVPTGFPAVTLRATEQGLDGGVALAGTAVGSDVVIAPGETVTVTSAIITQLAGADQTIGYLQSGLAGIPAGARLIVRNAIQEKSGALVGYFDGNTTDEGEWTYAWVGTVDASASTAKAPGVAGLASSNADSQAARWRSPDNPAHGTYVARHKLANVAAIALGVTATLPTTGEVYTVMGKVRPMTRTTTFTPRIRDAKGTPFVAEVGQWTPFRLTIAAGTGSNTQTGLLLVANSGHQHGDIIDLDEALLVAGEYTGPYFDGESPDEELSAYEWTGTTNASASNALTRNISGTVPEPLADYLVEVAKVKRFLHDVAAVNGPLVQQELQSGPHWGVIVEYTLAAGNPYVFGVMRPIPLAPRLPTVVQDVPYNLVPYPSAELTSGTVVVQTNYVRNPSVEVDAANFTANVNVITPAPTGERSTELAAQGAASYKVSTITTNSGVNGTMYANQEVPLPAYAAGQRLSFNAWIASVVASGTAVFGQVRFKAEWRDAANAIVGTVDLGTGDADGAAISAKSILRPANANSVRLVMVADLASWSVGADIALYTDALAVTIP